MKKIISIGLALITLLSLLSLTSCSKAEIDLRDKDNVYDDLAEIIKNHESYKGKTIAFTAECVAVYNFSTNKVVRYSMLATDESGEKRALYEIRSEDNRYPKTGKEVTVFGTINKENYIEVDRYKGADYTKKFDIDALDFTPNELTDFIRNYRKEYSSSEYYGQTIRIFGHLKSVEDGYVFLLGLDENGQYVWDIEIYDPKGKFDFPTADGDTVNPVEIVGKLSTYTDKNVVYACIEVKQVGRAESVFKEDIAIK